MQTDKKSFQSILSHLPPMEKQNLLQMWKSMEEQCLQKEKYIAMYEKQKIMYEELQHKYQELFYKYEDMKGHMLTTQMAIRKAKQIYAQSGSKSHQSPEKSRENTEERFREQSRLEKRNACDFESLRETWLRIPKSSRKNSLKLDKEEEIDENDENSFDTSNYLAKTQDFPSIPLTNKKAESSQRKLFDKSHGREKDKILNLKKEIELFSDSIVKNREKNMSVSEKIQKCNEIKQRYKRSKSKNEMEIHNEFPISEDFNERKKENETNNKELQRNNIDRNNSKENKQRLVDPNIFSTKNLRKYYENECKKSIPKEKSSKISQNSTNSTKNGFNNEILFEIIEKLNS